MDPHGWIAIAVLVTAMVLFITKAIPLGMTALGIPVVLAVTGCLDDPRQALAGFGNNAVIALAGVFVLGAGLEATGVANLMGRGLERMAGKSPTRLIVLIMVTTAVASAFLSNAATVAVLIPAVAILARRTQIATSKLMMPLAYAAVMGGMLTLIGTTPHLIISEELRQRAGAGFGVFEFATIGVPVVALGILFMATVGKRLLPEHRTQDRLRQSRLPEELARSYGFQANLCRMRLVTSSRVVGKTIREAAIGEKYDLDVVLILRPGGLTPRSLHPRPDLVLLAEDQLYLEGETEDAWHFAEEEIVQFGWAGPEAVERILGRGVSLGEVTVDPRSTAIGKTLKELDFRREYGLNAISLWRRDEVITAGIGDIPLELGDALLVSGPPSHLREVQDGGDFILLSGEVEPRDHQRAPFALLALLIALVPPVLDLLPLAVSALAGGLFLLATRCLTPTQARRSVDWTILFLLIGTIPLGTALEQTGVAKEAATALLAFKDQLGEAGMLAMLYLVAAVLSTTSNNAATAVILAPVAWQAAAAAGMDPKRAFLAVAYGTSCAFMLPFAHQCNLMVMGPGAYETRDFVRVGAGLSVVVAAATIALLTLL